jgi:hypothetical protein
MRRHADLIPAFTLLLVIQILFQACKPMAVISIQVMEPGEVTLPPDMQHVAFINRAYMPTKVFADTIPWTDQELNLLDTIVNYRIFNGITDGLNDSPLFALESISVIQDRRYDTSNFLSPLSPLQLDMVEKARSADALVSLEYYMLGVERDLRVTDIDFTSLLKVSTRTFWRIYDLDADSLVDEHMLKDTVIWQEFGNSPEEAGEKLPILIDALREAFYHAGESYARRISPSWFDAERYFFWTGNQELKSAAQKAETDEWEDAAVIWRRLAYENKGKSSARACYNLALFNEMNDRIEQALEWANKSYSFQELEFTRDYIDLLEKRKKKQQQLELQLPAGN